MKVKMVDIARKLDISKATVSLAVNGKPGVSEETRARVLSCIEEMKQAGPSENSAKPRFYHENSLRKMIQVVIINRRKQVICDPQFNLLTGTLEAFDRKVREEGFIYSLSYINDPENAQDIIRECNSDMVAGVIMFGTEMEERDMSILREIHKPMILYDYDSPNIPCSCICMDNHMAVRQCMDNMKEKDISDIIYLSTSKSIYNFDQRRKAFRDIMSEQHKLVTARECIPLGGRVDEIAYNFRSYFQTHKLPQAFLTENYQVSMGVIAAARQMGIRLGKDVKLVGIDKVPDYALQDINMSYVLVQHEERAVISMNMLKWMMQDEVNAKLRIMTETELVLGDTL